VKNCLQRIMGVQYSFPANLRLSADCLDLIQRIFSVSPSNRVTLKGLKSHRWFLTNLPEELKVFHLLSSLLAISEFYPGFRLLAESIVLFTTLHCKIHQLIHSWPTALSGAFLHISRHVLYTIQLTSASTSLRPTSSMRAAYHLEALLIFSG
jgi:hypothetical protein